MYDNCYIYFVHVLFCFTVVWLGKLFKQIMSLCIIWSFWMQILEIWSFQGTKMCFVFNDAKPFMVERVEGDDQLLFCLGAN